MKISPERWKQLEPHLDTVLDLDPPEREAHLASLAAQDPTLAADLRALLREPAKDWESLPARAGDLLSAVRGAEEAGPDLADRHIGPWRIVRVIGRGGMGVVYLAERADGKFEQQAAIKVMHWTGGAHAMKRFRLEQQTLARLDHPSITRIFDSGMTEEGLPYFVMEWVAGMPITRAAEESGMSVRERVRLFIRLCEAVHSAHQRLVVHRDIKPDNVMLTPDGHVKVLDFGIAKWLTEDHDASLTQQGEGLLTPQYASPEQFLEQAITTSTDVYALGLLLHEILSGRPPYDLSGKSMTEQKRLVAEHDPARLSSHAADPRRRRELAGDLERITARALHKDPARRYDSAAAMADDLRRFLDGLPVQATPDSLAYRASRFVRRHRGPVAIGALAVIALVAAAMTTAWQARVAARERDHARIEAARSEQIVDFLVSSLEQTNPYAENVGAVTMREFLEQSSSRIETELADQPDVRTKVYSTMSRVFVHVGEIRRGQHFAERAIQLADSVFGPTSLEAATARSHMARAVAHSSLDSAMIYEREALGALRGRRDRESRILLANVLEDHGAHREQVGETDSSLALHREALAIRERLYDKPHGDLARSHHHLASLLANMGDPEAGSAFEKAALLWKQTLGTDHPNHASTLNNWAAWLEREGRPDSARVLYERSLEISRRTLGAGSGGLATPLNNLGRLELNRGQMEAARAHLAEAAGLLRGREGSDTPLAGALMNLGLAAFLQDDYVTAEARYREGRALFEHRFGADHAYVAIADSYLGRTLWKQGRTAEAERRLARATTVLERHQPAMASRLVAALTWAGRLRMEANPGQGELKLRAAVALARERLPEHSAERGEAEVALGTCLRERGAPEEGSALVNAGYGSLLTAHGATHPMTLWAREEAERSGGL